MLKRFIIMFSKNEMSVALLLLLMMMMKTRDISVQTNRVSFVNKCNEMRARGAPKAGLSKQLSSQRGGLDGRRGADVKKQGQPTPPHIHIQT